MSRYRMKVETYYEEEPQDYYFEARDEETARTWFALQMYRMMRPEHMDFDTIYLAQEGWKIIAVQGGKQYFAGTLQCIPNRFRSIDRYQLGGLQERDIHRAMKRCCKTLKRGEGKEKP